MDRRRFLATGLVAALPDPRANPGREGVHHVYDFRGSAFEIGFTHGKSLAAEIREEAQPAVNAQARASGLAPEVALRRIVSRYEGLFREHVPGVLEEIRGIAEGGRVSYPYAFFAATRDQMRAAGACTAFCATGKTTAHGEALLGQTKDTSAPLDRYRIMHLTYAAGRTMVVLNYPGWIGNLCLTSDGLSFAGNSLFAAAPAGATVPGSLLKRLFMEKRSLGEVLTTIRGMRFENGCYLAADRSGHAVCLECVSGHVDVRDVSGEAFGHANSILSPSLRKHESLGSSSASSPLRQKNIDRLLAARRGAIAVSVMKETLRDHTGFPLSICRHLSPKDAGRTTAAFIADLTRLEMHIAIGNPCVAGFKEYVLLSDSRPISPVSAATPRRPAVGASDRLA
jgi:isopenicillin-N N-acyltransferase-like protein